VNSSFVGYFGVASGCVQGLQVLHTYILIPKLNRCKWFLFESPINVGWECLEPLGLSDPWASCQAGHWHEVTWKVLLDRCVKSIDHIYVSDATPITTSFQGTGSTSHCVSLLMRDRTGRDRLVTTNTKVAGSAGRSSADITPCDGNAKIPQSYSIRTTSREVRAKRWVHLTPIERATHDETNTAVRQGKHTP